MADENNNVPIKPKSLEETRGFEAGLDKKLIRAEEENLKEVLEEEKQEGDTEAVADVTEELKGLEEVEEIDEKEDPKDEIPDNKIG